MPNFPSNYKEQESYYASQEYQTAEKTAIKDNKKLPVYGGPQGGLDKKKKQRLIKLIMRLDGVKIYDEFKKPSEAVLTVKNVELLVEDVKATIRGFKHGTE